ncbi:hypothetical protein DH2020_040358 [Rehmannia glutinosa]|uniref:F-box domain-containing protein n=1 Tax=Rehmannia glutinosa TaxID=99300 RepID=A0ABR0UT64_REHGL
MGKVSPNDRQPKNGRQKRRLRNSKGKYLKPGALAQLRNTRASASKSCTDLGKKRVEVLNAKQSGGEHSNIHQNKNTDNSPTPLSPVRFQFGPVVGPTEVFSQNNLQNTPRTPRAEEYESESRLESLPIDILVKILCHLHHDQLRAVFHVSQKIRKAFTEMRPIAAVLFQESSFSSKCLVPSVLQKPLCKSLGSNRVLFYEDELCQAVAQNKLR